MKAGEFNFKVYDSQNGTKVDMYFNYGDYTDSYGMNRTHIGEHHVELKTKDKYYALRKAKQIAKTIF